MLSVWQRLIEFEFRNGLRIGGVEPADGSYDPNLAVLTLTVVAVIWYTYFTYCGVHREPPTILEHQVTGVFSPGSAQLNPIIANRSPRTVVATLHLTVRIDDDKVPVGAIYRGETQLTLSPFEVFKGSVSVSDQIMKPQKNMMGEMFSTRDALRVVFQVDWVDDLKEKGTVGPKYWHATTGEPEVLPVIAQENIIFPRAD